jgi:hypothetical protein
MTTPTNEEVRRQFEAEHRNSLLLERRADGQYASDYTQAVFDGYQAALRSPAVAGLVDALKAVAPYVVSEVLEHCNGNKCREQWCAGCMGDEHAEASVEKAREASSKLYAALSNFHGTGHE